MERPGKIPNRILVGLLLADLAFMIGHFAVLAAGIRKGIYLAFFALNFEMNPASWFAASQLLVVALVLFVLSARPFAGHPRIRPVRWGLLGLGALYAYLSVDEGGVIHERVSLMMQFWYGKAGARWYVPNLNTPPLWLVPVALGAALLVGLAIYLPRMYRRWPRETVLICVGFVALLIGGVLFEKMAELFHVTSYVLVAIEEGVEETIENVGTTLVVYAVISMLAIVARQLYPSPAEVPEIDASA